MYDFKKAKYTSHFDDVAVEFGTLRALLYSAPNSRTWRAILELLFVAHTREPRRYERELLPYALEHMMDRWPRDARTLSVKETTLIAQHIKRWQPFFPLFEAGVKIDQGRIFEAFLSHAQDVPIAMIHGARGVVNGYDFGEKRNFLTERLDEMIVRGVTLRDCSGAAEHVREALLSCRVAHLEEVRLRDIRGGKAAWVAPLFARQARAHLLRKAEIHAGADSVMLLDVATQSHALEELSMGLSTAQGVLDGLSLLRERLRGLPSLRVLKLKIVRRDTFSPVPFCALLGALAKSSVRELTLSGVPFDAAGVLESFERFAAQSATIARVDLIDCAMKDGVLTRLVSISSFGSQFEHLELRGLNRQRVDLWRALVASDKLERLPYDLRVGDARLNRTLRYLRAPQKHTTLVVGGGRSIDGEKSELEELTEMEVWQHVRALSLKSGYDSLAPPLDLMLVDDMYPERLRHLDLECSPLKPWELGDILEHPFYGREEVRKVSLMRPADASLVEQLGELGDETLCIDRRLSKEVWRWFLEQDSFAHITRIDSSAPVDRGWTEAFSNARARGKFEALEEIVVEDMWLSVTEGLEWIKALKEEGVRFSLHAPARLTHSSENRAWWAGQSSSLTLTQGEWSMETFDALAARDQERWSLDALVYRGYGTSAPLSAPHMKQLDRPGLDTIKRLAFKRCRVDIDALIALCTCEHLPHLQGVLLHDDRSWFYEQEQLDVVFAHAKELGRLDSLRIYIHNPELRRAFKAWWRALKA